MPSDDRVLWCEVCGDHYEESRVDMLIHVQQDHSLKERQNSLMSKGPRPEDTHA